MLVEWSQAVAILNFVLILGITASGIIALRSGKGKAEQEISQHTILALQAENSLLHSKITRLEEDVAFLEGEIKRLEREITRLTEVPEKH